MKKRFYIVIQARQPGGDWKTVYKCQRDVTGMKHWRRLIAKDGDACDHRYIRGGQCPSMTRLRGQRGACALTIEAARER